jgi:NAD(P)-dependent dehydrogenase (short-subunit alcohol dehydrogenase family)
VVGAVRQVAPDDAVAARTIRQALARDAAGRGARKVTACRIVGDWRDLEAQNRRWENATEEAPAGGTSERLPELRALAESLRTLRADVGQSAGWYEDTDARNTAAQLRRAAKAIDVARARLERVIEASG